MTVFLRYTERVRSVAVVVLAADGWNHIRNAIPRVLKTLPEYANLYLIYNSIRLPPPDLTNLLGKAVASEIKYIPTGGNPGFARAYNKVLKQIRTDAYVIMNHDVYVTDNWLNELVDFLNEHPYLATVQPKIKSWNNPHYFEYAGACGGWIDILGIPFCRGRVFNVVEKDIGQYDKPCFIHWSSGACMLIRSKAFHSVGGFAEEFFMHMEEVDLGWRLIRKGWLHACYPQSVVYHAGGASLNYGSPRKLYLNILNNHRMLRRNTKGLFWLSAEIIRLTTDLVGSAIVTGSIKHAVAALKAYSDYLRELFKGKCKYVNNYPERVAPGKYPGTILIPYFIENKKTFKEIVPDEFILYLDS